MKPGPNIRRPRSRGSNGKRFISKNQSFESNGPDIKVRGTVQQVLEKYLALARDASLSGDRVAAEGYFQHAEHYFRLLRAMQPTRPASEILGRDHFSSGFDIDFEDEGVQAQADPGAAFDDTLRVSGACSAMTIRSLLSQSLPGRVVHTIFAGGFLGSFDPAILL